MLYPFEVLRSNRRGDGVWEICVRTSEVTTYADGDWRRPVMLFKQLHYFIEAATLDDALVEVARRVVSD